MTPLFLNYHHLRYFWETARSGSLRAASEKLRLSQPTISAQIKALEESLGEQLFERSGRGLKLTATGRLVSDYAGEIFTLGGQLLSALQGTGEGRPLRLNLGVADSLPKLVAWTLIRPATESIENLQLSCVEGRTPELLGQLAAGRLDMVLADEPAPSSLPVKVYSHLLGQAPVVFCATAKLAAKLRADFPKSLNRAPALLPASRTAWRHELDRWFEAHQITPRVVAEFDDAALLKTAASDGLGFAPIAAPVLDEAVDRYGLRSIGRPVQCGFSVYLITVERSLRHPAVAVVARAARDAMKKRAETGPIGKKRK
jgi:LysR family transcriptional activator of nhaA